LAVSQDKISWNLLLSPAIYEIHRGRDTVVFNNLEPLFNTGKCRADQVEFRLVERGQHEGGWGNVGRRAPDPDPYPGEFAGTEMLDD
jgi:hypothetical protein